MAEPKLKVFVSYSRDDLDFADQLTAGLQIAGFDPLLDRHSIEGGEAWKARLTSLILSADTVVFVLTPSSARSPVCAWEVDEALRYRKRIFPVCCRALEEATAPAPLRDLNYIYFYRDGKLPGSGFGTGLTALAGALNTNLDWIREHTRLLQRATEWEAAGRQGMRLLSGGDILAAKIWATSRPEGAPEPTALHLEFIRKSEETEQARQDIEKAQLEAVRKAQEQRGEALAAAEQAQLARARQQRRATVTLILLAGIVAAVALASLYQVRQNHIREARLLNSLSSLAMQDGHYDRALRYALAALPSEASWSYISPLLPGTRARLAGALLKNQLVHVLRPEQSATPEKYLSSNSWQFLRSYPVWKTTIDADGKLGVTLAGSTSVPVFNLKAGTQISTLVGHNDAVVSARFSPDGSRIVTASLDGTAKIWNSKDGTCIGTLSGHKGSVLYAEYSPSGTYLVTVSRDQSARIWDGQTNELLRVLDNVGTEVVQAQFSPDGSRLAFAADTDSTLWETTTWTLVAPLAQRNGALSVQFSRNSARIALGTADNTIHLVDGKSGAPLRQIGKHEGWVWMARFSPDDRLIASVSSDGTARLWEVETGTSKGVFRGHSNWVYDVVFSPDGKQLATASRDQSARVWDVSHPSPERTDFLSFMESARGVENSILVGHENSVMGIVFDPTGQSLITTSSDGSARIWRATPPIGRLAQSLQFAPWIIHFDENLDAKEKPNALKESRRLLDVRSDLRQLATSNAKSVSVFRFGGNSPNATIELDDTVHATAFSRSGHRALSTTKDTVLLWDVAKGQSLTSGTKPNGHIVAIFFDNEIPHCLLAKDNKLIDLNIDTNEISDWMIDAPSIERGWLDAKGKLILTQDTAGSLQVQKALSGRVFTLNGHRQPVRDAKFSNSGDRIATLSLDGTARLWDSHTGAQIASYRATQGLNDRASGWINTIQFSGDSHWLLVSFSDGIVRMLDALSGEQAVALDSGMWAGGVIIAFFDDAEHKLRTPEGSWDLDPAEIAFISDARQRICREILRNAGAQFFSPEEQKAASLSNSNPCTTQ